MSNWVDPCPKCTRKYRAIGGDGPQPASVLCIAERPGEQENRAGRVLVGKSGQELDELYLPLAGLDRAGVRVCNTVLCWADNNKTPTDKQIAQCAANHLPLEITMTNPETIILMGATPCGLLPGINLKMMHGIPQHTDKVGALFGWSGWVVPCYHPAMGLHESRWMKTMCDDWRDLGAVLTGGRFERDPPEEPTIYREGMYVGPHTFHSLAGVDTESHGGRPWSVQVSMTHGTGMLWRTTDANGMGFLREMAPQWDVVLHNAAYDLEVLRRLGIHIRSYRDTMQESFQLGDLPQGLKELSYRLFRHTMTSYEETVRPASIRKLIEWMTEALQVAIVDLSFTETIRMKTKVKEVVHKGELETLLTRLLRLTDPDSEYDPWGNPDNPRLEAFWRDPSNEWMAHHVEARIGPYPILGIANCAMDEAVRYAVGDADYTGRVAVELARRRQGAFQIYHGDRDASM